MRKALIESNPLVQLSIEFAIDVVAFCDLLISAKHFAIANQLIKSGISIGANAMEAQNAESKADFIHKIKIAAKEADETQYWLLIIEKSPGYPKTEEIYAKLEVLQKILGSIISTAKNKSKVIS